MKIKHERTTSGIANKGFSGLRRFVLRFKLSCTMIGNRPQSLTGHTADRYASCAAFLTDDTNHIIKNKTMKTIIFGILLGIAAGIIDVIPMIIKKLTWDANISAFVMWVIVGFLIATTDLNMNPILKGILIAFLVLTPCAVLIGWKEPKSLIPIFVMTLILGGLLGFLIPRLTNN